MEDFDELVEVLRILVKALAKSRGIDLFLYPAGIFYDEVYIVQKPHAYPLIIRKPIRLYLYVPP